MRTFVMLVITLALAGCRCCPVSIETTADAHVVSESKASPPPLPVDHSNMVGPVVLPGYGHGHGPKIALIDVDEIILNQNYVGVSSLGENPVALFREKLDAVAADPAVRAVVLRINSPGGSVTATDTMWRDLYAFRTRTKLPIVTCMMDHGTGGAYYLACGANVIVAQPTTVTGGIGVILNLYNLREFMAQNNIFAQEVKSGENIDMGTSARNLPAKTREWLEGMADEFHDRFIRIVRDARPNVDIGPSTFDGRVFTAEQALKRGLIDRIGYLDDAIQVARSMIECDNASVVLYRRPNSVARSQYAILPNLPVHNELLPSIPGLDRRRLPTFLYIWQPEIALEKSAGH